MTRLFALSPTPGWSSPWGRWCWPPSRWWLAGGPRVWWPSWPPCLAGYSPIAELPGGGSRREAGRVDRPGGYPDCSASPCYLILSGHWWRGVRGAGRAVAPHARRVRRGRSGWRGIPGPHVSAPWSSSSRGGCSSSSCSRCWSGSVTRASPGSDRSAGGSPCRPAACSSHCSPGLGRAAPAAAERERLRPVRPRPLDERSPGDRADHGRRGAGRPLVPAPDVHPRERPAGRRGPPQRPVRGRSCSPAGRGSSCPRARWTS